MAWGSGRVAGLQQGVKVGRAVQEGRRPPARCAAPNGAKENAMIITLKREGACADCGAVLAAGTSARWYRNGKVYGLTCHPARAASGSRWPKRGARAASAPSTFRGRCEDAPCCGCCDVAGGPTSDWED